MISESVFVTDTITAECKIRNGFQPHESVKAVKLLVGHRMPDVAQPIDGIAVSKLHRTEDDLLVGEGHCPTAHNELPVLLAVRLQRTRPASFGATNRNCCHRGSRSLLTVVSNRAEHRLQKRRTEISRKGRAVGNSDKT